MNTRQEVSQLQEKILQHHPNWSHEKAQWLAWKLTEGIAIKRER